MSEVEGVDETQDLRTELETGVDSAIADFGGFFLALARTWGLQLFKPFKAAERLLADSDEGHLQYVRAGTFLILAGQLVSFLISEDPQDPEYVGALADAALKLLQLEADILVTVLGGVVQAVIFYVAARLLGLCSGDPVRGEKVTIVAMYVFPTALLGVAPYAFAAFVLPAAPEAAQLLWSDWTQWALLAYGMVLAPALMLGAFGWKNPSRWGRWTALAAPLPLVMAVAAGTITTQAAIEDYFDRSYIGMVWLAPADVPTVAGVATFTHFVELRAWHDRPDPVELCKPVFCPTQVWDYDDETDDYTTLRRVKLPTQMRPPGSPPSPGDWCERTRFQERQWIPPEFEVGPSLVMKTDCPGLDLLRGKICCEPDWDPVRQEDGTIGRAYTDEVEICFEGYRWFSEL